MIAVLIIIIILTLVFLLSLMGRINHPGLTKLIGWSYAHRGLHGNGVPENSMQAFRRALERGYGIEFDIHLMKDGRLAVIHDASLKRTAGVDVNIEDLTSEDLVNYSLEETDEKIPLFDDVLKLYNGKAPLIVELKPVNNHASLCEAVSKLLDQYNGAFCVESFDPRCVAWFRKNRPDYVRGQLSENFLANAKSKLPFALKCAMSWNMSNFLTLPDFVAYKYADRNNLTVKLCRRLWNLQGVTWTLKSLEEYNCAVKEGWIPIFENFEP
ncbi:MAG: glycerophosphodiester phosphodiesterase [Oscillospiraceae bacterium]|nr:glycerophosphodiester phosphodiesterase [Oscillospiraceae bacterium]